MPQLAEAQINVRIDRTLKEKGDAALAHAGFTPSQAVRMLWTMAAQREEEPEMIAGFFEPEDAAESMAARKMELERRRAVAERAPRIIADALASQGTEALAKSFAESSYDDLKRGAYEEEYGIGWGWKG